MAGAATVFVSALAPNRIVQMLPSMFRARRLWKKIINEGLWAGFMLFFLRWSFDVYLSLLSGQKMAPVLKEKLSHFPSEFIEEGYIYLVAGALLGSLVWTIVSELWDAYLTHKAFYAVYPGGYDENRFWLRVLEINGKLLTLCSAGWRPRLRRFIWSWRPLRGWMSGRRTMRRRFSAGWFFSRSCRNRF